jgi:hypothetical protein
MDDFEIDDDNVQDDDNVMDYYYDPVFHTEINIFDSVTSHNVINTVPLYYLLEEIPYNLDGNLFLKKKFIDGVINEEYTKYKETLKVVCFNTTFNGYCDLEHVDRITNLMYLDIDNFENTAQALDFKDRISVHYDWIVACYLSPSMLGLHIIIKVDKIIDSNDFKSKCRYIDDNYFDNRLDKNSFKLTQFAIISFDNDIYINKEPATLPIDRIIQNELKASAYKHSPMVNYIKPNPDEPELKSKSRANQKLRYNNFDDFDEYNDEWYIASEATDIEVIIAYITKIISIGCRQSRISSFANNFLYLNPWLNEMQFITYLQKINRERCVPPLSEREIEKITKNKFDLLVADKLKPIYKNRMVIFHPTKCKLSVDQKKSITNNILCQNKKLSSRRKLRFIIDDWDFENYGKISIRNIVKHHPISKKTVEKYYKEFHDLIKDVNQEIAIYKFHQIPKDGVT